MNTHRSLTLALLSACALGLGATGCSRAETPARTQADVSTAQVEGAQDVEQQRHDAAQDTIAAQAEVAKADAELAHQASEGTRDVSVAEAEAAHKVTTERCEAMSGDARDSCKKQADVDLNQAREHAEQVARSTDPKR